MSDHERTHDPSTSPSAGDGQADGHGREEARVHPPVGSGIDTAEYLAAIYGDGVLSPPAGEQPPPAEESGRRERRRRRRPDLVAIDGGASEEPPADDEPPRARPKIKWLRLMALLSGLGLLAAVSTVFGMMMAVASDLPEVDVLDVAPRASRIVDRHGKELGVLTGNENRILVHSSEIAPVMKHAIVAIEDRRFYTNPGVDFRGIARALWQDVIARKAVQGGSTITQQLVKNRLEAQNDRTLFQKLREAAMAFHMTRKWDKDRILRNYLNTIYFGNGAYGIEAAARAYFGADFGVGTDRAECGSARGQRRCAELLEPQQAALIAGIVASPSAYDPIANPQPARERRDLVLLRMLEQGYLTRPQYDAAVAEAIPAKEDIHPPQETSRYPYFTTWVRQQVVDKIGAAKAFEGGLKVETTIDSEMQDAAQAAVDQWIGTGPGRPSAALVALDNRTSEVLAMVGGAAGGYNERPFNLATQGQRQPGSSFKPFILAEALRQGISPTSVWSSRKKEFCVTRRKGKCVEYFEVNNYEDTYAGVSTLANATAFSDNSVFAEIGIKVGTRKVARLAREMGVRTPVATNPAMTLGGLPEGVTVIDMAHAYETFASDGRLIYGSMSPGAETFEDNDEKGTVPGPVGIREITEPGGKVAKLPDGDKASNRMRTKRVLPEEVARTAESMMTGVVRYGSGKRASLGAEVVVAGKTGTTEDYGDAWFVGWTPRYTVAVWVGYPDKVVPMKPPTFSFQGEPVSGGTYPAAIWQTFMKSALDIFEQRHPQKAEEEGEADAAPSVVPGAPSTAPSAAPDGAAPSGGTDAETAPAEPAEPAPEPEQPAPEPEEPAAEQPAQPAPEESQPAPETGGAPTGGGAAPPPE